MIEHQPVRNQPAVLTSRLRGDQKPEATNGPDGCCVGGSEPRAVREVDWSSFEVGSVPKKAPRTKPRPNAEQRELDHGTWTDV